MIKGTEIKIEELIKQSMIDDSSNIYKAACDIIDGTNNLQEIHKQAKNHEKKHNKHNVYQEYIIKKSIDRDDNEPDPDENKRGKKDSDQKKPGAFNAIIGGGKGMFENILKEKLKHLYKMKQMSPDEGPTSDDKAIYALKYKEIFEDLVNNDDIIKERNSRDLSGIYKTMMNVAPRVSTEKEIVRAWLRLISGQPALSPYDAKQLAELESYYNGGGGKK